MITNNQLLKVSAKNNVLTIFKAKQYISGLKTQPENGYQILNVSDFTLRETILF